MKRFLVEIDPNVQKQSDEVEAKKIKSSDNPLHTSNGLTDYFINTVKDEKWLQFLRPESEKLYFRKIMGFVSQRIKSGESIRPTLDNVFRAFNTPKFDDIKVVIVGQDPYPGVNDANGLSFAVNPGIRCPGSLRNIFKNIRRDYPGDWNPDLTLLSWAKQGVLMLNTGLTVKTGAPASHQKAGWELFTDNALRYLLKEKPDTLLLLMGNHAQKKKNLTKHVIMSAHPSPLSVRYFENSHPFRDVNVKLQQLNFEPIDWTKNDQDS